jgi:hypothetical protein
METGDGQLFILHFVPSTSSVLDKLLLNLQNHATQAADAWKGHKDTKKYLYIFFFF